MAQLVKLFSFAVVVLLLLHGSFGSTLPDIFQVCASMQQQTDCSPDPISLSRLHNSRSQMYWSVGQSVAVSFCSHLFSVQSIIRRTMLRRTIELVLCKSGAEITPNVNFKRKTRFRLKITERTIVCHQSGRRMGNIISEICNEKPWFVWPSRRPKSVLCSQNNPTHTS